MQLVGGSWAWRMGGGLETTIPAWARAGLDCSPHFHCQQRPRQEKRACLFSSETEGAGSRISKRSHPLLPLPSAPPPPATPQAAFQNLRGSCPGRNPLNQRLRLQRSCSRGAGPFPA